MTKEKFETIELGTKLHNPNSSVTLVWEVTEIATDSRTLTAWQTRGIETNRVIKVESHFSAKDIPIHAHTWVGDCNEWEVVENGTQ